LRQFHFSEKIKNALFLANSKLQVDTFLFISLFLGIIFLGLIYFVSPIYSILGLFASFIPAIMLRVQINKRFHLFTQQFPDALNMISSSLRAGHPLLASFETVVQEMPQPVSTVFKTAVDEISLGIDAKTAMNSMINIIPASLDLKFFVTAVLIQREVGGNLAELLDGLSITIRERFKLLGQLKAQTAQTRFSGLILSLMPPLVGGTIFILNPEYMEPLLKTQQGNIALLFAVFLTLLGLYFINKITDIEM
jgi:tight adherence protein B